MKYHGAEIAIGALAINSLWATVLFVMNMTEGVLAQSTFEIARIGSDLVFELGWVVDGLSIMMFFLVSVVGLIVFIYAVGYMKGDVRVDWFFAAFSLFAGSMLILVGGPQPDPADHRVGGSRSRLLLAHRPLLGGHGQRERGQQGLHGQQGRRRRAHPRGDHPRPLRRHLRLLRDEHGCRRSLRAPGCGGRRRWGAPLLRGDGQERSVPAPHLAPRRHGWSHAGLGTDARGDHGHGRDLSDGAGVPVVRVSRRRHPALAGRHRGDHPLRHRSARPCR